MKILSLDTATEACSAALYIDGEITQQYQLAPREHTQLILKMAERLLSEADLKINQLDCLAFGRGPGSFTGVRIATGVIQGLAFAADLPVVPVSTLAALAQYRLDQDTEQHVLAAIDARMGGIYWGCYQASNNGLVSLSGEEQVSPPELLATSSEADWCITGSAWSSYQEQLQQNSNLHINRHYADDYPRAASMLRLAEQAYKLGEALPAHQAQPVYLRNDVAKKAANQAK